MPIVQSPNSTPVRTRARRFATPRLARNLAGILLFVGIAAAFAGVAYDINGATQAHADVHVPVLTRQGGTLQIQGRTPAGAPTTLAVKRNTYGTKQTIRLDTAAAQDGIWMEGRIERLTLRAWDSTVTEQMLSRGGLAVLGLCLGAGALLLHRVLLSVAAGNPFEQRNPARLAGIAGLTVIAGLATQVLPALASDLVLRRVDLGPDGPLPIGAELPVNHIVAALLLLVLAEAFRRGSELSQDVEGLV